MSRPNELTFYTKQRCPLCDEGAALIAPILERWALALRKVDIETRSDLYYRHRYRIPVVALGDEELDWGRLDPEKISKRLEEILG